MGQLLNDVDSPNFAGDGGRPGHGSWRVGLIVRVRLVQK